MAWDNGRMDQWPRYKNPISMGYFKEAEIPFQYALANAFTMCDAYHCAMHTGTDANRSFFLTGTNGPYPPARPSSATSGTPSTAWPRGVNTGYTWTTYAERLEARASAGSATRTCPTNGATTCWARSAVQARQHRLGLPRLQRRLAGQALHQYRPGTALPRLRRGQRQRNNPLYKGIANTLPGTQPEQYLDAFKRDIREGKLPQVSWLNAPSIYCEHPGPSSPVQGAWFLQEVLDALTANPEVWSKTVLIVTFDENDGYFDHVPSPSAPSPNGKGGYAGKTTLAPADLAPEYYTHGRLPAAPVSRLRTAASTVPVRACRCT
jgi:phospholipase C